MKKLNTHDEYPRSLAIALAVALVAVGLLVILVVGPAALAVFGTFLAAVSAFVLVLMAGPTGDSGESRAGGSSDS